MHRDVYDTHHLHIINDAQLMIENVINDVLLQGVLHIKHVLIQLFGVMTYEIYVYIVSRKSNPLNNVRYKCQI